MTGEPTSEEVRPSLPWQVLPDSLSLVQRILLITDGTVTHIVQEYAGEPICVVKLSQSLRPSGEESSELQLGEEETVLRRKVLLQGQRTGRNFVYAESVILADRLPEAVRDKLQRTDEPLGKVLQEHQMETFREIIHWGEEPVGEWGEHFGIQPQATAVSRSYRVWAGQKPIMLITEKFPVTAFTT